jgi:NAD-dependent protein deacetylase/lipoamidase
VDDLAGLVRASELTVVLTGAGISVPSGIPDFRSPGTGLWANVDPMKVAHIDAWRSDPDQFWAFYGERFASLVSKRPNRAHEIVAELEQDGQVHALVTQNIDRLHRMAGSERLIEMHGCIEWSVCMECGGRTDIDRVVEMLGDGNGAPECTACIAPLKPDVVLFGEMLPERAMREAQELAVEADLMIAIGSSLTVHPVAALPELTLRAGGKLAIITESATPLDSRAAVKLTGDVVDELDALQVAVAAAANA